MTIAFLILSMPILGLIRSARFSVGISDPPDREWRKRYSIRSLAVTGNPADPQLFDADDLDYDAPHELGGGER